MELTDIHSHLMPGVDDGAQSVEQARAALRAMQAAGVATIVTTPHVQASLTGRPDALAERLAELDAGWHALTREAVSGLDGLTVRRGVELALDTPEPDLSDDRLRLAGGQAVLVEFPYMTVPPHADRVLAGLRSLGWLPIVAHPERYGGVDPELEVARTWRQAGACLQLNAGSLLGRYGEEARRGAVKLLERGWIDCIASDHHARGRVHLARFIEFLAEHGGAEQAHLLAAVNPARIVDGETPIPVAPVRLRQGLWARVVRLARAVR